MYIVLIMSLCVIRLYFTYSRVTSAFLVEGTLNGLHNLIKLNLSRTSVDDEGMQIIHFVCDGLTIVTVHLYAYCNKNYI